MKFQIISDIHLEFGDLELPGGDLLIMAGDILVAEHLDEKKSGHPHIGQRAARYRKFVREQLSKYNKVLYVLGNHEYYGGHIERVKDRISSIMSPNVSILDNDVIEIDGKLFVGSVLWTDMNKRDWVSMKHAKSCMPDFRDIYFYGNRFTPEMSADLFDKNIGYIDHVAKENKDKEIIVITHHCPSEASVAAKFKGDILNGAFRSECSNMILDRENIKMWIHGHTHVAFDYMIGQCRVVCNPRGYYGHFEEHEQASKYVPVEVEV